MEVQELFLGILTAELNELPSEPSVTEHLSSDVLPTLSRLAKKHDLAHVLSAFLYRNRVPVEEGLAAKLKREELVAVYRQEQMRYAFGQISEALEDRQIPYIPLKGAILRPYYPDETMRTSCDIDVLIHEEDLESAMAALEAKGFRRGQRHYHDVSLYSESNVHLELHFSIQENIDRLDEILKRAWEYARVAEGCRYEFTEEFFVFHLFSHMSYHFLSGGCGIRSLMDVWIMKHRMNLSYTCGEELLRAAGIETFAREISILADGCFSGAERNEFSNTLLTYIWNGGVYGSAENHMAVQKTRTRSTVLYAIKRVFLPYSAMTIRYPRLKKLPFLLPFYWVHRGGVTLLSGKSKAALSEIKLAKDLSERRIEEINDLRTRLGL